MASWKRLHRVDDQRDVNMDSVLHMQAFEGHTALHFAVADGEKVYNPWVKEKPDEMYPFAAAIAFLLKAWADNCSTCEALPPRSSARRSLQCEIF